MLRATVGLRQDAVGQVELNLDEGLVGLAAERKSAVVIEHASKHARFKYFPETGEEQFESLMAAPLLVRGVALGVLAVQTIESRSFDREDVDTLVTCAHLLTPVVLNAQMIDSVAVSEEQRAVDDVTLALSGVPMRGRKQERESRSVEVRGIGTSRGIAIGPVAKLGHLDLERIDYSPRPSIEEEEVDLMQALHDARHDLDDTRKEMGEEFGPDLAAVFHTHIQILEDKGFLVKLQNAVRETGDGRAALRDVLAVYRKQFDRIADPYFRERA